MQKTVILGNIITVDEKRPFAKAAFVKYRLFLLFGALKKQTFTSRKSDTSAKNWRRKVTR